MGTASPLEWFLLGLNIFNTCLHFFQTGESWNDRRWLKELARLAPQENDGDLSITARRNLRSAMVRVGIDALLYSFVLRALLLPPPTILDGWMFWIPTGTMAAGGIMLLTTVTSLLDIWDRASIIGRAAGRRDEPQSDGDQTAIAVATNEG